MLTIQAEAYNTETFSCERCKHSFQATVASWVDASRAPLVRLLLQHWEFNVVACPHCGYRQFAGSFFFYEDFAEGLLVAVFPAIPDNRVSLEEEIRKMYSHYPVLDFFYDMTQLWLLIYLQEHYGKNKNRAAASKLGRGEQRLKRFLSFLKKDPLMLTLRDTLAATSRGNKTADDLQNILWRALAKLEGETHWPWPHPRAAAGVAPPAS